MITETDSLQFVHPTEMTRMIARNIGRVSDAT